MNLRRMLAVVLLGACASRAASAPHDACAVPALARFADAFAFVPPDMLSFSFDEPAFVDQTAATAVAGSVDGMKKCLRVRAGRDFEMPEDVGRGKYRGVEIMDFGAGGASAQLFDEPANERLDGLAAWFRPGGAEEGHSWRVPSWAVMIDARFVIVSSEREVLQKSLRRAGRIGALVDMFPAVRGLGADVVAVVCLLPRPGDTSYWGRPVPSEVTIAAIAERPLRLQIVHRQALPEQFDTMLTTAGGPRRSGRAISGWTCDEAEFAQQAPLREHRFAQFVFEMLFGLAIFI